MRVSSTTAPSLRGTLKSTRTSTRFPRTSTSRTVSLSNIGPPRPRLRYTESKRGPRRAPLERTRLPEHVVDQIDHAVRVAPFIVIPRHALHEGARAAHDHGLAAIEERGERIAHNVDRYDRVFRVAEEALH